MDPEYARRYRDLWERHWWWRARTRWVLETVRGLRAGLPPGRILDVGCAGGVTFPVLRPFGEVEGVEPDPALMPGDPAARNGIHHGPFDETFRPGRRYDLVLMLDVLEHLPDPVGALRHAGALLAPQGRIVLTLPAFPALWTGHDEVNRHLRRYTRASLREECLRAGVEVLRARYLFHWLFLPKLAVRLLERAAGPRGIERVPPPAVNAACEALSRAEQAMFRHVPLPFGTTLAAVCAARREGGPSAP